MDLMQQEKSEVPSESRLILAGCRELIPATTTISQLKPDNDANDSPIKSTAVERTREAPVVFRSLQLNTNISRPPENWLKTSNQWEKSIKKFVRQNQTSGHTNGNSHLDIPHSFQLANDAVEVLPYVDVVSNAEDLKSLLKIPYDDEQIVSLAIHKIGPTLLIDNFDAYSYLLDVQRSDWNWIRQWFADNDGKRMALLLAANSSRSRAREKIKERDMLSKFLYYSIDESEYPATATPTQTKPEPDATSSAIQPAVAKNVELAADVAPRLSKTNMQKSVVWNLEDMKLLVGSDLPVFSTGAHPCFSLRLCDKARPINVITGLNYWLDNLMCNVPEILMCYHVNGIVQQYEVFKTEDLPNLSSSCHFSPQVVRNFATNILSFLRSNATKEGHTYWLLKEPDLDVVKLYDLTSICEEFMDSVDDNPFALPLAVLLCRLAYTVLEQEDSTPDQLSHVRNMLDSCIKLIDRSRHPWLYSVVNYLNYIAATKKCLPDVPEYEPNTLTNSSSMVSAERKSLLSLEYIANGLTFLFVKPGGQSSDLVVAPSNKYPVQWTESQQEAMISKLLRGGLNCYLHIAAIAFDALVAKQGVDKQTTDKERSKECICIELRQYLQLARNCLVAFRVKTKSIDVEVGAKCALLQLIGDLHFIKEENHQKCSPSYDEDACDNSMTLINQTIDGACSRIMDGEDVAKYEEDLSSLAFLASLSWPKFESAVDRIESAIKIYEMAFEGSDDKAAVVRRMANACVEFANAIITKSLAIFSAQSGEPLQILWKKAYFAFDKAALLFESVRPVDYDNLAVVESNRARLMRVCAHCQPTATHHYLTEAARRYAIALKHQSTAKNTSNLASRMHWDLSSVYLALADHTVNTSIDEDADRNALKYLSDASAEATAAGLGEVAMRDSEISFREGKIRKKMLLRLVVGGSDSKMCLNYFRLAEKSFEKSVNGYCTLRQWEAWVDAHCELSSILLDSKLSSMIGRKTFINKINAEIGAIVKPLMRTVNSETGQIQQWQTIVPSTLLSICNILAKLLRFLTNVRSTKKRAVEDICEKLNAFNEKHTTTENIVESGEVSALLQQIFSVVECFCLCD